MHRNVFSDFIRMCAECVWMIWSQVATFILQKILLDETGLSYICQTYERFSHVAMILVRSSHFTVLIRYFTAYRFLLYLQSLPFCHGNCCFPQVSSFASLALDDFRSSTLLGLKWNNLIFYYPLYFMVWLLIIGTQSRRVTFGCFVKVSNWSEFVLCSNVQAGSNWDISYLLIECFH